MSERVSATPAAIELIQKLTQQHGPILFLQSGGCCEGSVPLCTILDAMPGSSGSFSLDCGSGMAFITRGRLFTDEELETLPPVKTFGLN